MGDMIAMGGCSGGAVNRAGCGAFLISGGIEKRRLAGMLPVEGDTSISVDLRRQLCLRSPVGFEPCVTRHRGVPATRAPSPPLPTRHNSHGRHNEIEQLDTKIRGFKIPT